MPSPLTAFKCCAIWIALSPALLAAENNDPDRIRPYARNPYYWQYKGKPVLLLGGSVEDNLFQIPDLVEHLDLLCSVGGNYVRCTMSWRDPGDANPFAKRGDKFDLDAFNPEFFNRFDTFLAETARRDIIVQVELWATFDYYQERWRDLNAFNPKNNVNYTAKQTGLRHQVNSHPVRAQNDFFRSIPAAKNNALVLKYQQRFIAEILAHSLKYDHVLYAMDNETAVTPKWGACWSGFIKDLAAERGKIIETTEMWDNWDVRADVHRNSIDHPEIYSFLDISQNNHQKGQTHYDHPQVVRDRIKANPRPINSVKAYGADGGRFGNTRDGVERFWRNLFGGFAAARFHRPNAGIGLNQTAQRMIRSARTVTDALDVFSCAPRNDLLADRDANEAYCLADPPRQYALYFPANGNVTLSLAPTDQPVSLRWFNIDTGQWQSQKPLAPNQKSVTLKTPTNAQWAAVLKAKP